MPNGTEPRIKRIELAFKGRPAAERKKTPGGGRPRLPAEGLTAEQQVAAAEHLRRQQAAERVLLPTAVERRLLEQEVDQAADLDTQSAEEADQAYQQEVQRTRSGKGGVAQKAKQKLEKTEAVQKLKKMAAEKTKLIAKKAAQQLQKIGAQLGLKIGASVASFIPPALLDTWEVIDIFIADVGSVVDWIGNAGVGGLNIAIWGVTNWGNFKTGEDISKFFYGIALPIGGAACADAVPFLDVIPWSTAADAWVIVFTLTDSAIQLGKAKDLTEKYAA